MSSEHVIQSSKLSDQAWIQRKIFGGVRRGAKHQVWWILLMNQDSMLAAGENFENSLIFVGLGALLQQK